MSGFRTIVPQVQAALLAAITPLLPTTTSISLGYPAGGLAVEQVWLCGDFDSEIAWATTGWKQREEDSTCEVRVSVVQTTPDFLAPQAQALLLAGCVEDALALDRTLGGIVDRAEVTHGKGQEAIPEESKRQYGITLTVSWAGVAVAA